jgi:hypothetical protein
MDMLRFGLAAEGVAKRFVGADLGVQTKQNKRRKPRFALVCEADQPCAATMQA